LLDSLLQHAQQAFLALGVAGCPFGGTEGGFDHRSERTEECERLWPAPATPITPALCPSPDAVDRFFLSFDFLQTFFGQGVKLSSILFC
jgi:hypothetical protein